MLSFAAAMSDAADGRAAAPGADGGASGPGGGDGLEVAAEQREEADEVLAVPVAVDVRLADADAGACTELVPEGVGTAELDEDRRPAAVTEASPCPSG